MTDLKMHTGMASCMQCGAEALKMAKLMPAWTPGTVKGKPVKCYKILTVEFDGN